MANNIVAQGTYNTPTLFHTPWPFYIVDNFLSAKAVDVLKILYNHTAYEVIDSFHNGAIFNTAQVKPYHKIKKSLPLYKDIDITKLISDCVISKLSRVVDCNNKCMPELIKCDPGYRYNQHKDHPGKKSSIVVFLEPQHGDATTLIDHRRRPYQVAWRQNRALIFNQHDHGLHSYNNTTSNVRITLNIYMVDFVGAFCVDAEPINITAQ